MKDTALEVSDSAAAALTDLESGFHTAVTGVEENQRDQPSHDCRDLKTRYVGKVRG